MSEKRIKTDGEVAIVVNKVARSLRQLGNLPERGFSPDVAAKRERELRERIEALIVLIESSEHPSARQIAESIQGDFEAGRAAYVAAGARRFFEFPLNWIIHDGEVAAATVKVRKPVRQSLLGRRKSQAR